MAKIKSVWGCAVGGGASLGCRGKASSTQWRDRRCRPWRVGENQEASLSCADRGRGGNDWVRG